MTIFLIIMTWFVIGFFWVKRFEGGWLIMITDSRNSRHTWMALPALVIAWALWPICNTVARLCFMLSR